MLLQIRLEPFRALDVAVRKLQGQVRRWVPGNAATVGIEAWPIEIVPLFVRFASGKNAAFDFHAAPLQTGGGDAERDVS